MLSREVKSWIELQYTAQAGKFLWAVFAIFVTGPISFNYILGYVGSTFHLHYWQGIILSCFGGSAVTWLAVVLWFLKLWGFEVGV